MTEFDQASIGAAHQETRNPEHNDLEKLHLQYNRKVQQVAEYIRFSKHDKLHKLSAGLHLPEKINSLRTITSESHIPGTQINRTLSERNERREILKKFWAIPHEDRNKRRALIAEAHDRDNILQQYLNQSTATVELAGIEGQQSARVVRIEPPVNRKKDLPPVVLIPGISNDLGCVEPLLEELAMSGRTVICIGYPESFLGQVSPEFVKASVDAPDIEPHTRFFRSVIEQFIKEGKLSQFELWSHSRGAEIVAKMTADPQFRENVTEIVQLCPTQSSEMNMPQAIEGIVKDMAILIKDFPRAPKYTKTGKFPVPGIEPEGQRQLKTDIFNHQVDLLLHLSQSWKKAHPRDGGTILYVTYRGDDMTRSRKTFNKQAEPQLQQTNPQLKVLEMDGVHNTPLTQSDKLIKAVDAILHPDIIHS